MRTLGTLLMLVAVGLFYLSAIDRHTPLALSVVELETRLRCVHLYSLAGIAGVALWAPGLFRRFLARSAPPPVRTVGHRRAQARARGSGTGMDPGMGPVGSVGGGYGGGLGGGLGGGPGGGLGDRPWRESMMERLRGWEGGAGARLLIDHSQGVPLTLVLEHLSPRHAERSVGQLGLLLQTLPLPPRLRIRFSQCPEGPSSRHHMVGKALGAVLDPGCFKAVATTDQVDVMFLSPDPRWRTDW